MSFFYLIFAQPAFSDDPETSDDVIIVTEESESDRALESTASLSIIPIDEKLSSMSDLGQVVGQAAGTRVVSLGGMGDFSAVSLRGATLRQTLVMIDGIPLNPDGASVVNLSELPLQAFSRVEIYRGFTPPTIPSSAMGGVIQLVSKNGDSPSSAKLAYASLNTWKASAFNALQRNLKGKQRELMTFGDFFTTSGNFVYFDNNGTSYNLRDDSRLERNNNDKAQGAGHIRFRIGSPNSQFTLLDSVVYREEGISGSIRIPSQYSRLETKRNLFALDYFSRSKFQYFRGQLWHLIREETFDDQRSELGLGSQWNRYQNQSLGGMVQYRQYQNPNLIWTVSLSPRIDDFKSVDLKEEQDGLHYLRWGSNLLFASDVYAVSEKLRLTPTVLVSTLSNPTTDESWAVVPSPQLGIRYLPIQNLSLKASAGHYFRQPNMGELYGDKGFTIGNPNLKPELGWQGDVGYRFQWDKSTYSGSWDSFYFWNPSTNRIAYVQNSQLTQIAQNIGSAWVEGVESSLFLQFLESVEHQSTLSYTKSENREERAAVNGAELPRTPKWEVDIQHAFHIEERLRISHSFSYSSINYWDALNWFGSTPRQFHSAFIRLQPRQSWPHIELGVNNIMNTIVAVGPRDGGESTDDGRAVIPLSDYSGYPIAGRTLYFSLKYQYAKY